MAKRLNSASGAAHLYLLFLCLPAISLGNDSRLKVLTLNIWTGFDYHGVFSIGEYETAEVREKRYRMTERMLLQERPDIVALQEVNPVHRISKRLADALGYDVVDERVNSGLKIGMVGFPWNLNEGIAILARKDLHLEFVDVWVLSNTWGIVGEAFSLHSTEHDIALVARVRVEGIAVYVVNTHTISAVPVDSGTVNTLRTIAGRENVDQEGFERLAQEQRERFLAIRSELREFSRNLKMLPPTSPVLVAGDFNVDPQSAEMGEFLSASGLFDASGSSGGDTLVTWDANRNTNVAFSRNSFDARGRRLPPLELLSAAYDSSSRRIDYILLNPAFDKNDVKEVRTVLDTPDQGLFASDHYGMLVEISLTGQFARSTPESFVVPHLDDATLEPFPIASYDTDVGFGYGGKVFWLNPLGQGESFDLVLFNSTKGERWYRLVFSIPDFELRQGKIYPLSVDVVVDYDKYLKNSFFGIGNGSSFASREFYTREPLEINIAAGRAFTEHSVGQFGAKFKYLRNGNFSDTSRLAHSLPSLNSGIARYHSITAGYRFDTRNSFINPSRGWVIQAEGEYAPLSPWTNVELGRLAGWVQHYSTLFYPKTVLALRIGLQGLLGNDLPVQVLLPIGGNQTLRGSVQDRFLDKCSAIVNAEVRFPIFWRFGGVVGYDAGRVWESIGKVGLNRWATNPVLGLRFFMETFVVRMDVGLGSESTGFYLNFGHLF